MAYNSAILEFKWIQFLWCHCELNQIIMEIISRIWGISHSQLSLSLSLSLSSQDTYSPADWMPTHKPTELSRINIHTYMHDRYIHTYMHACIHVCIHTCIHTYMHAYIHACMHTYIHTYMLFVVNVDALAQTSDFRIERRQVVFLCWMQDSNQGLWKRISNRLNAHWQTDCPIEGQAKNSIHTCFLLLISVLWHTQAIFERRQIVFLCWMQDSKLGSLRHQFASRLSAHSQTDWVIKDQAKSLNSTACMHTYIHTYMHTYIHTYIHTYTHILTHTHTYIYIYIYIHINTNLSILFN